jgi:hypothetical protein
LFVGIGRVFEIACFVAIIIGEPAPTRIMYFDKKAEKFCNSLLLFCYNFELADRPKLIQISICDRTLLNLTQHLGATIIPAFHLYSLPGSASNLTSPTTSKAEPLDIGSQAEPGNQEKD